jgi:hypothetical protein
MDESSFNEFHEQRLHDEATSGEEEVISDYQRQFLDAGVMTCMNAVTKAFKPDDMVRASDVIDVLIRQLSIEGMFVFLSGVVGIDAE